MVQTLTVWSNGIAEINTGTGTLRLDGVASIGDLQVKLDAIESTISAAGISQLHVEKDTFRQFEHAITAGTVALNDFGTTVSSADFDLIMQYADAEIAAEAAAMEAERAVAVASMRAGCKPHKYLLRRGKYENQVFL
jgi:hypothetical protein